MKTLSALLIVCLLSLSACQEEKEPDVPNIPTELTDVSDAATAPAFDDLLGRWSLAALNEAAIIVSGDEEAEAYLEFRPPCYEIGDGHCNEVFDGSWDMSERRPGRLSFKGYSGCNWFGAEAILEGPRLISKPVMTTQRGCSIGLSQEILIQKILSETSMLFLIDKTLTISNARGDTIRATSRPPTDD